VSVKCQRCSDIHDVPNECLGPAAVLRNVSYRDWEFHIALDGSYLQVKFSQEGQEWSGRKWRLSPHMTRSEIVQTAFMAALACEEHECREKFKYRGKAVFGPHFDVEALVWLTEQGKYDVRPHA
jgi:hypothetical protein